MRLISLTIAVILWSMPSSAVEETLSFGRFGTVSVYRADAEPRQVVIFVSGDGGWNLGVVDMARSLAGLDALVVGIDIVAYLKNATATGDACVYAAGDLEALSQYVQKTYGFQQYRRPVLVGYSSGATLVYATLVQAPTGTFLGGISLGFCPDLKTGKPLCKGKGLTWSTDRRLGFVYEAARDLEAPWTALHGEIDQVCEVAKTRDFVARIPTGTLVELPKVGHGFSVQPNWMPQFKEAFTRIADRPPSYAAPKDGALSDLPLAEVPAKNGGDTMAVLVTGDGGWAGLDRNIAAGLADRGIPAIGLDSLKYFWTTKTPERAAADLDRIVSHYLEQWGKRRVILVGYSFGADVLPFMARRMTQENRTRVAKVVLLGPSDAAEFEFHIGDWLGRPSRKALPVMPEINALEGLPLVCVFGTEETDSLCRKLDGGNVTKVETRGGHHFGGDVTTIVAAIAGK